MQQNNVHAWNREIHKQTPFCSNMLNAQSLVYNATIVTAEYNRMLFIPCEVLSKLFISIAVPNDTCLHAPF